MLEWFTTIPGILVIGGVILLVIAIILFAVSAKKEKKENMVNEPINNNIEQNNIEVNAIPEVQPAENVVPNIGEEPVVDIQPVESTVEPVVEPTVQFEINDISSVAEEPANPEVVMIPDEEPVINIPNIEPVSTDLNEPTTIAYGGEQPVIDFAKEEKPVTIYGGNDPLEATQKLPQVEETHMPYGGGYPEINIPEIASEPVVEPVVESISPMPTVEFNAIPQPEVVNITDMDATVSEIAVEPVIQPVQPVVEEKTIPVVEEL